MVTIRVIRNATLACFPLILAGCLGGQSPPSRFYTLSPLQPGRTAAAPSPDKLLVVGPVVIPAYLDRPQIVTRTGTNELVIAEFNRWGGTLGNDISRVLVADLSTRLGTAGFTVLPWQAIPLSFFKSGYRVSVDVSRFDGVLGKEVVLSAAWQLLEKQGLNDQPLLAQETTIIEPTTGGSYDDLVAAMERAVRKLGAALSDSIRARSPEMTPRP